MKSTSLKFKSLLLLLIVGIAFSSCNSDDDNNADTIPNPLVGKWFFSETNSGQVVTECERNGYIEFNASGDAYTILYIDAADNCIPFADGDYGYELLSENTIKFMYRGDGDGEDFNTEILSISETQMMLKGFIIPESIITFVKATD